jgi:hypothetical protein
MEDGPISCCGCDDDVDNNIDGSPFFGPVDSQFPHPHPDVFDVVVSGGCGELLILRDFASCCCEEELLLCNTTVDSLDPGGSADDILVALYDIL